jgi:hypothetical protein
VADVFFHQRSAFHTIQNSRTPALFQHAAPLKSLWLRQIFRQNGRFGPETRLVSVAKPSICKTILRGQQRFQGVSGCGLALDGMRQQTIGAVGSGIKRKTPVKENTPALLGTERKAEAGQ